MDPESGGAEPLAVNCMVPVWEEMWRMPRILWSQWCDVAIGTWVGFQTGRPGGSMPRLFAPPVDAGQ